MTALQFVGIEGNWDTPPSGYTGVAFSMMTFPAGLRVGDLMLAAGMGSGPSYLTAPAGWNVARAWSGGSAPDYVGIDGLFWKVATQADLDAAYFYFQGAVMVYRGVDRVLEAGQSASQSGVVVQYEATLTYFANRDQINPVSLDVMSVPTRYVKDGARFAGVSTRGYGSVGNSYGWLFGCCHDPHSSGVVSARMALGAVSVPIPGLGLQGSMWVLASGPGAPPRPRGLTMFM